MQPDFANIWGIVIEDCAHDFDRTQSTGNEWHSIATTIFFHTFLLVLLPHLRPEYEHTSATPQAQTAILIWQTPPNYTLCLAPPPLRAAANSESRWLRFSRPLLSVSQFPGLLRQSVAPRLPVRSRWNDTEAAGERESFFLTGRHVRAELAEMWWGAQPIIDGYSTFARLDGH